MHVFFYWYGIYGTIQYRLCGSKILRIKSGPFVCMVRLLHDWMDQKCAIPSSIHPQTTWMVPKTILDEWYRLKKPYMWNGFHSYFAHSCSGNTEKDFDIVQHWQLQNFLNFFSSSYSLENCTYVSSSKNYLENFTKFPSRCFL